MAQTTYGYSMAIGIEGQLADMSNAEVDSFVQSEASAAVAIGCAVKYGATDQTVLNLTATSEKVPGIVLHAHVYDPETQLDDDGAILPKNMVSVLRRGRVLVRCEEGCAPGDRLFIRAVAAGAERAGALRMSADGSDCIDCSNQGEWKSTAAAGELAWLDVDFTGSKNIGS